MEGEVTAGVRFVRDGDSGGGRAGSGEGVLNLRCLRADDGGRGRARLLGLPGAICSKRGVPRGATCAEPLGVGDPRFRLAEVSRCLGVRISTEAMIIRGVPVRLGRAGVGVVGRLSDVRSSSSSELSSASFSGVLGLLTGKAFFLTGEATFGGTALGTPEAAVPFRLVRPLAVLGEPSSGTGSTSLGVASRT